MAKFCTNCGKKLEDGKVCDCKKDVLNNDYFQRLLGLIKSMIYKPIDTIKDFTKKSNFNNAMILIGILSFIFGLFMMALLKNTYSLFMGSIIGGSYSYGKLSLNIPYGKVFFTSLIIVFALSFIYSGILYLVNKTIFKRECDFKEVYSLNGIISVILSLSILISSVLIFVNVYLGLLVFALGGILSTVYNYHGLKFIGTKDENNYGYIYLLTNFIFYIVIFFVSKIFS